MNANSSDTLRNPTESRFPVSQSRPAIRPSQKLCLLLMCAVAGLFTAEVFAEERHDVVIYGGTSGGVTAAVQAAKMGHSAVVINPYTHLGGMTSSGLGHTDSGRKAVIGGLSREFYRRVREVYRSDGRWVRERREDYVGHRHLQPDDDAQWGFEPHVAEEIFRNWLAEHEVPLVSGRLVRDDGKGVVKEGDRIVSIALESGEIYRGRMFIDATYEGDLLDEAGVSFIVGREGNEKYGETLNGIQTAQTINHVFTANGERRAPRPLPEEARVDPYVVPGDPSSGLLPGVNPDAGGAEGEGDHRVQSYCYRLCLTDDPENKVPFAQPQGYSEADYEILFRMFEAGEKRIPWLPARMPNRKTDTNNRWAVSMNLIGGSDEYPLASYERRREIEREHENWQRGLMWALANHERVPESIRSEVGRWGYAADEFVGNDHWPPMIYIRVGRRMVSDYVMTEHDCRLMRVASDSVGMGSYAMDSHNVQRYVTPEGYVQNEGNIEVAPDGPYSISYRSIVPARGEAENLLVPWAVSASHIAFGSIRMEPVFMVLGQSAATAASLAIADGIAVQDVDYETLRERLEADGQVLYLGNEPFDFEKLPGVVILAEDANLTGEWDISRKVRPFLGDGYYHDGNAGKGEKKAEFAFEVPEAGDYEIQISYAPNPNRAKEVPVMIYHVGGSDLQFVDQTKEPELYSRFATVGTYRFSPENPARIVIENRETIGHVILDSVRVVPVQSK